MDAPVYLLVGATGGIGRAVVARAAARGARLALAARTPGPLADLAAATGALALPFDATDPDAVAAAVAATVEAYGRLDGAACLAGSILLKPAHLTTPADLAETVAQNLTTAFNVVRSGARALMAGGGSLVLMSTVAARTGLVNHEAIAAAKAAVEGLARSAAATYAARRVRVNAVAPGLVDTPLAARLLASDAARAASAALHPLGRVGTPDDVAEVVDWLLDGTRSGWVTGQTIAVDGGMGALRARTG